MSKKIRLNPQNEINRKLISEKFNIPMPVQTKDRPIGKYPALGKLLPAKSIAFISEQAIKNIDKRTKK